MQNAGTNRETSVEANSQSEIQEKSEMKDEAEK